MKIIYDSEQPPELRCVIDKGLGAGPEICGCFDLKVEATNIETGRPELESRVARWGSDKERRQNHKAVAAAVRQHKE